MNLSSVKHGTWTVCPSTHGPILPPAALLSRVVEAPRYPEPITTSPFYEQFYVAMKHSGRYELVGAPADADLVLQLRFSAPLNSCQTYQPQLTLDILDTKTHFLLWTFTEAVKDVGRHPLFEVNANWDKNLKEGIDDLVDDLIRLSGQPANPQLIGKDSAQQKSQE